MSFWTKLVGGSAAEPIKALGDVADALFTSDDERLTHAEVKARIEQQPQLGQILTNQLQVQHRTWFVAGARPFILWMCGVGLAMYFLPQYAMGAILWTRASWMVISQWTAEAPLVLPTYPVTSDGLMELTLGLLGLGLYRSVEKITGVAK